MLKRLALLILIFLLFISLVVAERELPEGYEEVTGKVTTVFNYADIEELFGTAPMDKDGYLNIFYPMRGVDRELGIFSGTLTVNKETKQLKVINGSYGSPKSSKVNVSVEGDFVLEAGNLGFFPIKIEKGTYTQKGFTFFCVSDDCEMNALIKPTEAYLNLTDDGKILQNDVVTLEVMHKGKLVEVKSEINISNLHEIQVQDSSIFGINLKNYQKGLVMIANPNGLAQFDTMNISSPESIQLQWFKKGKFNYDVVRTSNADIYINADESFDHSIIISGNEYEEDGKISINVDGHNLFNLATGDLFIFPKDAREMYDECIGYAKTDDKDFYKNHNCAHISDKGIIAIRPTDIDFTGSEDITVQAPLTLTLKLPAISKYEKLLVNAVGEDIISHSDSKVILEKEGLRKKQMIFQKENVTLKKATWFDFGISFGAYILEKKTFKHIYFECNVKTKECYLDNVKIAGFTEQKRAINCEEDSDCGDERFCEGKLCKRKATCKRILELSPGEYEEWNTIDVLFLSDDYDSVTEFFEDVKWLVDKGGAKPNGLLSVEPFKTNQDKFIFWYIFGGNIPATIYSDKIYPSWLEIESLTNQCPQAEQSIILSKKAFRSYAMGFGGGAALVSMPNIENMGEGLLLVHEFGHSFGGLADEYYNFDSDLKGNPHEPNCIKTYDKAKELWGQTTADLAKIDWRGCGGDCDNSCKSYLRPSENSIMNNQAKSDSFNTPCFRQLEEKLSKFG